MAVGVAQFAGDRGAGQSVAIGMAGGKRERLESLRAQLTNERTSFISHWRDLSDYILPRRSRFFISDVNRGDRRNLKIIDNTATLAARTLSAGMASGVTNPARPWFRLTLADKDLSEFGPVKFWLHQVAERMRTVFLRSNLYKNLPIIYKDLGVFGTAAMLIEESFSGSVLWSFPFPIGSYMLGNDSRLNIAVFSREFRMTVRQIVENFGVERGAKEIDWTKISAYVRTLYEAGSYEAWVDVVHVVTPNDQYDENRLSKDSMKFLSCYYEKGTSSKDKEYLNKEGTQGLLRQAGYDYFPVLAPRWEVTGEDAYGTDCPGMSALGDAKQLQTGEKRGAQALDKIVSPPMSGPAALKRSKSSVLPGDTTYLDVREGQQGFKPVYQIQPRLSDWEAKQQQVRSRVNRSFYVDLFRLLIDDTRASRATAEEVREKKSEILSELGFPMQNISLDLLDPLIDITFKLMNSKGMFPEPPPEIEGLPIKVEYVSVLAQAQKLIGISSIERFSGFVGNIAATTGDQSVLDKVDTDQMVDNYADRLGVDPDIVRSDDEVAEIRADRAKAQQAAAAAEAAKGMATAAKELSAAKLDDNNALSQLMQRAKAGQVVPAASEA